jgi:hypothetical protein
MENTLINDDLINWLLKGDVSIQYQTHRDLLNSDKVKLRNCIENEGWGARFLGKMNSGGFWGKGFYQPKWISSHYTLLDLKNLGVSPECEQIKKALSPITKDLKSEDGGIYPIGQRRTSDVCLNGMFLNYASYFRVQEDELKSIIDFLLGKRMDDGGFNCESNKKNAVHSSFHTTISVLEGITEFSRSGYKYRLPELLESEISSREFLLQHKLFQSDRTGEIIDRKMLMLSYPSRWRYDILRALEYFRIARVNYDHRMKDAVHILLKKRRADGKWPLQAKHSGQTHFDMEESGQASRWNTLRALRVLVWGRC